MWKFNFTFHFPQHKKGKCGKYRNKNIFEVNSLLIMIINLNNKPTNVM